METFASATRSSSWPRPILAIFCVRQRGLRSMLRGARHTRSLARPEGPTVHGQPADAVRVVRPLIWPSPKPIQRDREALHPNLRCHSALSASTPLPLATMTSTLLAKRRSRASKRLLPPAISMSLHAALWPQTKIWRRPATTGPLACSARSASNQALCSASVTAPACRAVSAERLARLA